MKTISYILVSIIFSTLFVSCEVAEGENFRKYYKNQNHSEELRKFKK